MKTKTVSPFSIIGKFAGIVKLWQQIEKKPRKFGVEEDLYSSEIHLIEVIGDQEGLGVTEVARQLGVTKGAASQTLKKLEKKRLAVKVVDPENNSRLLIELTAKGKAAYYAHQHWHETMDGGFKTYFTNLPGDKLRFLDEFLSLVDAFLKKRL